MSEKNTVSRREKVSSIIITVLYGIILIFALLLYFKVINFSISGITSVMLASYCLAFMPLILIFYSTSNFSIHKAIRVIMFIIGLGGSIALSTLNNMVISGISESEFLSLVLVVSPYVGCFAYGFLFGYPCIGKSNNKIANILYDIGESPILRALITILIIPLAILIAIAAVILFFIWIFAFLFSQTYGTKSKKSDQVYVVIDNGYERVLKLWESYVQDYDTNSPTYREHYNLFRDDLGNFWRSYDNNKTFIKETLGKIY